MVYSGFTQMLTGVDLLAKVKDLGDVSKTDLATQCGYVSQKKDVGEGKWLPFYVTIDVSKMILLTSIV